MKEHASIDFRQEIIRINGLLDEQYYTLAAQECLKLIEMTLKYLYKHHVNDVSAKDRETARTVEDRLCKKINGPHKSFEYLTMGALALFYQDANFFDALGRGLHITDMHGLGVLDLKNIAKLRNKFFHERREATQSEARLLLNSLRVLLETFRIAISAESDDALEQIKFVNRVSEIQYLTEPYCPPYLLLNAPMGYGKTRLLDKIRGQYQENNWFCLFISLADQKSPPSVCDISKKILDAINPDKQETLHSTDPEECGEEVGQAILQAIENAPKRVLLMIDNIEIIDDDVAETLLNRFFTYLQDALSSSHTGIECQFRLILSGRYISRWTLLKSKIRLELYSLKPFDFLAVWSIVESFARYGHQAAAYQQDFAAHLMHITAGHPDCMTKILRTEYGRLVATFTRKLPTYYADIVAPAITEVKKYIPDDLQPAMSALSVVRRFKSAMLRHFLEQGILTAPMPTPEPAAKPGQVSLRVRQRIVRFLSELPNMASGDTLRALLYEAGFEPVFHNRLDLNQPPAQFFQILVPQLNEYGPVEDGRPALKALIEAAMNHVGPDKRAYGETLLAAFEPPDKRAHAHSMMGGDPYREQAELLENRLLKTYLLDNEAGFLQDGISRRLLSLELRQSDPARFLRVCEAAIKFYTDRLQKVSVSREDILANELCFQVLQRACCQDRVRKNEFFDSLPGILDLLVTGRDLDDAKSAMVGFLYCMEHDWEFRFLLNYAFRGRCPYSDEPYQEFLQILTDFNEQGGRYA